MRPTVDSYADLPVCVQLAGPLRDEVTAFAEAEAGWHVVGDGGPLLPALTVAGAVVPGRPTVVVVSSGAEQVDVRDAALAGAVDVVLWPEEKDRLLAAPQRLRDRAAAMAPAPSLLVGGCRGGVGASTIALTIAATVAWSGGRALCLGGEGLVRLSGLKAWTGAGRAELSALGAGAAAEVESLAQDVPGVPGLAVLGGDGPLPLCAGWPYDLVVIDVGTHGTVRPQVMVGAADAAVAGARDADVVFVVEQGPLDRAAVAHLLGRAPDRWLPYSHRVAKAGSAGRVPSSLPGSWVRAVRDGLRGVRQ